MIDVELPEEDYNEFHAQREKRLISSDPALPEYVRLYHPGSPGIIVQVKRDGVIRGTELTVYAVTYLIKRK